MSTDQFLTPQVESTYGEGFLSLGYTPTSYLEIYGGLRALSFQHPLGQPRYSQAQGDPRLGGKVSQWWGSFGLGFALEAQLFNQRDDLLSPAAVNFTSHGLMSYDLTRSESAVPFRLNLDARFTFENSESLFDGLSEEPSLVQEWSFQAWRYLSLIHI